MTPPKNHPEYGGTLTYYKNLEVGVEFRLANGNWEGKIIERNGKKKVLVYATGKEFDVGDRYAWLI